MTAQQFIEQNLEGLILQNDAHEKTWGLGHADQWSVDQESGEIVFTFPDKIARAPVQIIGTFNSLDSTFLWAWDHPSVLPQLQEHARLARDWGARNKVLAFTSRKLKCTEDFVWGFTAVAARVAGANGAYRGPAGSAVVFMTFGNVRVSNRAGT